MTQTPEVNSSQNSSQENKIKVDLELAHKFLSYIHPHPQPFILEGPDRRTGKGIWYQGKEATALPAIAQEIRALQVNRRTIQFTPNSVVKRRSNANVVKLNCFYADVDKNVHEQELALQELCTKYDFPYQIKIETRPGKYQYFWLINPVDRTPSTLMKYMQVAEEIRRSLRVSETTTTDISHLMRVPGCVAFREDGMFLTKLEEWYPEFARYSLDDLSSRFPVSEFKSRYVVPQENSVTDNRNNSLRDFLAHCCSGTPTVEDLEIFQRGFIEYAIPPEHRKRDGFLEEIKDLPRRTWERLIAPTARMEAHASFKIKPDETLAETHPEEFYLNCPGGIGDVVRYLAKHAPHIPAACHFAGTYGPLSALAAYSVRDENGGTPTTYMGIAARSGTGKTVPLTAVRNALNLGGFNSSLIFTSKNTTDVGMVMLLRRFGAVGCMYTDEAYDFFNARTHRQTASYNLGVYAWLLELFSAHSDLGVSRGASVKELEKNEMRPDALDSLDCPRLSWVYGIQPDFFKEHFLEDKYLVTQGFAGRILNIIASPKNSLGEKPTLMIDHFKEVWSMLKDYPCITEALRLHTAYYGPLEPEATFTPVGPSSGSSNGAGSATVIIEVPPDAVFNGHSNGNSNGTHVEVLGPETEIDTIDAGEGLQEPPPQVSCSNSNSTSKRGRKSSPKWGLLPDRPESIVTRSDVTEYPVSSFGSVLLKDFNAYCELQSSGSQASANVWCRGGEQVRRIVLGLRAYGADELAAIRWAIEFVKGCFNGLDTAYHKANAGRSDGKFENLRKRLFEYLATHGKDTKSNVLDGISKKRDAQQHLREIIKTEIEGGNIVEEPGKSGGKLLRLVAVPSAYLDS